MDPGTGQDRHLLRPVSVRKERGYQIDKDLVVGLEMVFLSSFFDDGGFGDATEKTKGLSGETTCFQGVSSQLFPGRCIVLLRQLDDIRPMMVILFGKVDVE